MHNQKDIQLAQANTDPGFKIPADQNAKPASAPALSDKPPAAPGAASTLPAPGAASTLPAPGAASTLPAPGAASAPATNGAPGAPIEVAPVTGAPATDSSTRDVAIGGAVFLILLVVFFFARNAYANNLVRRRVAPSSADTAGWLMFFGLAFLSAAAVLAVMNASRFLTVAITGTLLVFGIAALAGALLTGRR